MPGPFSWQLAWSGARRSRQRFRHLKALLVPTEKLFFANMPAVQVFKVYFVTGREAADYPFTRAFYESAAYSSFRKRHFPDLMLPCTMGEAAESPAAAARSFLLWDPRFASL